MPNHKLSEVRAYYEEVYHKNARFSRGAAGTYYRQFLTYLNPVGGGKLLDISCGTGELLKCAADSDLDCVGIDISLRALNVVHGSVAKSGLVCCQAERLPFGDNWFDYVTCLGSLEHFLDPELALNEMVRVSKPAAAMVLLVPNVNFERMHLGYRWLSRLILRSAGGDTDQIVSHSRSLGEWVRLVDSAGLRVLNTIRDNSCSWGQGSNWLGTLVKRGARILLPLVPIQFSYQIAIVAVKKQE